MGTNVPSLRLRPEELYRSLAAEVNSRRNRFKVPELKPLEKRIQQENCVHIFNVGPWPHRALCGSWGIYYIPECPKGQTYSAMNPPIPGMYYEPVPEGNTCRFETYEGIYVAEQILGIGKGLSAKQTLVRQGVFMGSIFGPKGVIPAKEDLDKAKQALHEYYQELMREATGAYNISKAEAQSTITDTHRTAARELNRMDVPWLEQYTNEANLKCPVCRTVTDPDAIMCPASHCGYVYDEKRFAEVQGRMANRQKQKQQ